MNESNGRQQLCLKWNNHYHAIQYNFETLLQTEDFADVTLATEGQHIRAHKIVLSSCSPLFQSLLRHTEKDTIIILPSISYAELKAIIVYMYRGEVNIAQDDLPSLLKAAENLQVRGLSDPATEKSKPSASAPATSSAGTSESAAAALLASPSSSPAKRELSTREPSPVASKRKKKTSRAASVDSANDSADSSVSESPDVPSKKEQDDDDDDDTAAAAAEDKRTELGLMMEPMAEEYDDDVSGDEMIEEADEADVKPGPSHRGLSHSFPGWASASSRGSIPDVSISAVGGNLDSSAASADGRDYYEDEDSLWAPLSNSQGQTGASAAGGRSLGKKRNGIFPCAQCGRTYMRKDSLRRHLMWECGKEPQFQCPYCPQRSKRKAHHDRHIFRLHKDKLGLAPDADESAMNLGPRLITPTVTIEPVNSSKNDDDDDDEFD
ncbi:longitudinals lacking protein, isoforms A/B/D/L-like isoform X1 [Neocloeon triangulifer]|uniref:longitudinals lacking protein, isoforms A/B/D/L-like isoform X1 n=1 Tax=Neocloeon triangulifer TaxID=2078957 RepID=UPI00286ECFF0|nr:longitudinals lacking protein, isoforms A/B/D/L-like isoform X1 [Neocloeon triangulifer]